MQLTQLLTNDTLLAYSLVTSPSPVQVSPQSGPPSVAVLTFVVSCPVSVGKATVTQIAFNLPVGDPKAPEASDLTETAAGVSASVSSSGSDRWLIGPGAAAGTFVLKPASGGTGVVGPQGLTVTFTCVQVSPIVGTAVVNIVELATASGSPQLIRQCAIGVAKFPYGFFVANFAASAPQIQHGATVTLSWMGSVQASYTLIWDAQSQDVSRVNQWRSPALVNTTTFILEVSAQQAGQTVTLRFSVTVIVANPDFSATTLTVLRTSALRGDVAVGTDTIVSNLAVSGTAAASSIRTAVLAVNGATTTGALTVTGAASAGALNISGASTLAALTVAGQLSARGRVSLLTGIQIVGTGSFATYTDGFVVGHVGNGGPDVTKKSWARISAGTASAWVEAVGGNTVIWIDGSANSLLAPTPSSFALPVRQGDGFWTSTQLWDGNQYTPATTYYWYPMGNPSPQAETIRKTSDKPPRSVRPSPLPKALEAPDATREVASLVSVLNRALKRTLTAADQARLKKSVASLLCATRRTGRARR